MNATIPPPRRQDSFLRLPLLWMFMGPPAIRVAAEGRTGLASLAGDQDLWNYVRLAWWLCFGLVAVVSLVRNAHVVRALLSRLGLLPHAVVVFLAALLAGSFASSVPLFSIANVIMMILLAAASLDLAVRVFSGRVAPLQVLRGLLLLSVGLLVFVGVLYLAYPHLRWSSWYGVRLRGESFAYVPVLALISIVVGSHFFLARAGARRFVYMAAVAFGAYWLYLAQTRSAYLCLAVAMMLLAWYHLNLGRNRLVLTSVGVALASGLVAVLLLYGNSHRVTWYLDSAYKRFVVRDYWAMQDADVHRRNMATLNGRTEAAGVLIDGVMERPYGYGYIGGVRAYMSRPDVLERLPDDAFIGAHNGYLEVLGGGGFLALLAYLAMLGWFVVKSAAFRNVEARIVQVLLVIVLVEGVFESEIAYPFHQSPVVLWLAGALIAAAVARSRPSARLRTKRPKSTYVSRKHQWQ